MSNFLKAIMVAALLSTASAAPQQAQANPGMVVVAVWNGVRWVVVKVTEGALVGAAAYFGANCAASVMGHNTPCWVRVTPCADGSQPFDRAHPQTGVVERVCAAQPVPAHLPPLPSAYSCTMQQGPFGLMCAP